MITPPRTRLYLYGLIRTLVIWFSEVLGLVLMVWLLPGLTVASWPDGFVFIGVVGLLNALLWPLLSRLTLRFLVYSFGIGALLLNALMLWLGSQLVPEVTFDGIGTLILTAIGVTAVNTLVSFLLTIDDEASYYRHALRRQLRSIRGGATLRAYPGVVFVELDGLSEPDLRSAIQQGHMPALARWLERGSHHLIPWESDTSSQTGAAQAGILHGNNRDLPAFRWVEKAQGGRVVASSDPSEVPQIEKRISDGQGLLSSNGYSRINMFSGDAAYPMMTVSRLTGLSKLYTPFYYMFFSNPYNVTRTIVLLVKEILTEYRSRWRQKRDKVWPRLGGEKRGGIHPLKRAFVTVVLHDVLTYTLMGDIFLGEADAIYATYVSYDELAHYCGPRDADTLRGLTRLDQAIDRLERATQVADRPYEFVILSDHGQTQGATFKQRYHTTLEDLVRGLLPPQIKIHSRLQTEESWDRLGATLTDVAQNDPRLAGRAVHRATRRFQEGDRVVLGPERRRLKQERRGQVIPAEEAQVIVLASGNLGLVYFADWPERMSYEQINHAFPDLIPGLVGHEGIGFVLVQSAGDGGLVLGKNGRVYLDEDRVEGENPLANFRPRAAQHLRRTNRFRNAPDILVNSFYDPEQDEGAAFEEQIGFHGGLGGAQAQPFLLFPTAWGLGEEELVGAEQLYRVLKRCLEGLRSLQALQADS